MLTRTLSLVLLIGAAIALIMLSPSCGSHAGHNADFTPDFQQGNGVLPGTVGTIGKGPISSTDIPAPQQISGGSSAAPLGTNPAYNVSQGAAVVTPVHSSSRAVSSLAPGQLFKLNRITLVPKGQAPNWSSTSFVFNEGDTVDFYAEYEVAANVQFTRTWTMDSCGLDYAEPPTTSTAAGTYLAMWRYTLPYGSANDNADFNFEAFYGTRTASASRDVSVVDNSPLNQNQSKSQTTIYSAETSGSDDALFASSPAPSYGWAQAPSKSTSVVVGGGNTNDFDIIDITMMPDGAQPDWSLTHASFNEGDSVDLWIQYRMNASSMSLNRHWSAPDIGLNQTDSGVVTPQGTYSVKLDWVVPANSAKTNCIFQYDLTGNGKQKFSAQFPYDIIHPYTPPPPTFNIIDITMMPDGTAPDWNLTKGSFTQGQSVDLWIKYEMLAPSMNIDRHWYAPDLGLDMTDPSVPTPQGTYTVKLDWNIPTTLLKNNCIFNYDLLGNSTHKYSDNFPFDVAAGSGGGSVNNFTSNTNVTNYTSTDPGIFCGHIDVDTSHLIYAPSKGSTDGHIHQWDDQFNSIWINYFDMKTTTLHNIQRDVAATQKFKIILSNADLSPGARIVINKTYNENDPSTYILATAYDDIPVSQLPIYSLSGVAGTTKLTTFEMHFLTNAIANKQVIPTVTGSVRSNIPGAHGETRNGALTIQVVKVNADGTNAFTTNTATSAGGVQGTATSGLAWESTTFWHWKGPAYNQSGWSTYDPTADYTCTGGGNGTTPTVLANGEGNFRVLPASGLTTVAYPSGKTPAAYPNDTVARMCWEDLQAGTDYDYNEFVGDLHAIEWRTSSGAVKQVQLYIKADARGATDTTKAWQFNMDGTFPGANAQAMVNQYYDDEDSDLTNDNPHVYQSIWNSTGGVNVPIFVTTRDALPMPADSTATTNTKTGTTYVKGDYAIVTITFDTPVTAGTYTPAPYNPELRVQQGTNAAYIYHLWRHKGDALLSNGFPSGGFILPGTFPWTVEGKAIDVAYPAFDTWVKWLSLPASDDPRDPNVYLTGTTPAFGASIFGSPQPYNYWTGATGQTDFHTATTGEMDTLTLVKYLNGDPTVTSQSISKIVLNPCKVSQSYDTHLPLRLTKPTSNPCDGYADLKTYINNGVATNKPMDYQEGVKLISLVLNVERGHVQPNEWVWIPELGEIRPIVSDPVHMPSRKGVIQEANDAWALPAGAANDAKRQLWRDVCTRINNNTYIIQQQYWPAPAPNWWTTTPTTNNFFLRSQFK